MSEKLVKWEITHDYISTLIKDNENGVGTKGPHDCPDDDQDKKFKWTRFRMYDSDGELYYAGRMNEHCEGLEPLVHFGRPNAGCSELREWVPGKGGGWVTV